MRILINLLLCVLVSFIIACGSDKKKSNDSKAKTDHVLRPQFDALEKAKKVEKELQDVYKKRLEAENGQNQ